MSLSWHEPMTAHAWVQRVIPQWPSWEALWDSSDHGQERLMKAEMPHLPLWVRVRESCEVSYLGASLMPWLSRLLTWKFKPAPADQQGRETWDRAGLQKVPKCRENMFQFRKASEESSGESQGVLALAPRAVWPWASRAPLGASLSSLPVEDIVG